MQYWRAAPEDFAAFPSRDRKVLSVTGASNLRTGGAQFITEPDLSPRRNERDAARRLGGIGPANEIDERWDLRDSDPGERQQHRGFALLAREIAQCHRYFLAALANHVVPRQVARIDRVGLSTLNSSRFTLLGARMGTQRRQNASTRRSHVGQPLRPASKDLSFEEFELREALN